MSRDSAEESPQANKKESKDEASTKKEETSKSEEKSTKNNPDTQVELTHIADSSVTIASGDIKSTSIKIEKVTIIQTVKAENEVRRKYKPPEPGKNASLSEKFNHWFYHKLDNDRERLFAITLSLFNGFRYAYVKSIYDTILQKLYKNEKSEDEKLEKSISRFPDPDNDLISKVKAEIKYDNKKLEGILWFTENEYETLVFDLVCRHHREILFDLLPIFKEIVENSRYLVVRYYAALAVAKISKLDFWWVRSNVLGPWANDQHDYVRATVGYSLAYLAQDENSRPVVKDLLAEWANPKWREEMERWRYHWTVASVYKEIGVIGEEWAIEWAHRGLKEVAGFDDNRIAGSVIHALISLSLEGQLTNVLSTLKGWIEEGSGGSKKVEAPQVRCIVAILAFLNLAKLYIELMNDRKEKTTQTEFHVDDLFQIICQSEIEKGNTWKLIVAVGVQSFEYQERHLYNDFFDLIARWAKYAADDLALQDTIVNLLVEIYRQVKPYRKKHICNHLDKWTQQKKDEYLIKIAQATKNKIEYWELKRLSITAFADKQVIYSS